MSLPRVVSLNNVGELQINPAEELRTIRLNEVAENDVALQPHQEKTLRAGGKSIELQLEFAGGSRSPFGVKVFASPDGREATTIRYEPEQDEVVIDFLKSSMRGPASVPVFNARGIRHFHTVIQAFHKKGFGTKSPSEAPERRNIEAAYFSRPFRH